MNTAQLNTLADATGALADKTAEQNRALLAQVCANPKAEVTLRRELARRGIPGEAIARILRGDLSQTDLPSLMPSLLATNTPQN